MSRDEMKGYISILSGEQSSELLDAYLSMASDVVKQRVYPFSNAGEIPEKYEGKVIEIAVYLINKSGAEGEISHTENGISRSYESASVPESMLKSIIPRAEVIG